MSYVPLSSTVTLHNISTSDVAINGTYGMPTSPYFGQVIHIKDFGGNASVANIILTYTNSNLINGYTNYNINKNYNVVSHIYYGLGSIGRWIKMNSITANGSSTLEALTDVSISNPSNDQILVFTTASSLNKWTPYTILYQGQHLMIQI